LSPIPAGLHIQLRADIEGALVLRSYTPTEVDAKTGRMELTLKIYPNGKMGNHLLNLPEGDTIDVRGPIGHFKTYHRFLCSHIVLIAGGTGITPMWQIMRAICEDPADETRITLLYANQTQGDILLRDEISALTARFPNSLKVHHFLAADSDPAWTGHRGFVTKQKLDELLPPVSQDSKYLVCGPPPMTNALTKALIDLGCDAPKQFKHATDQVFVF
jgi:cytochrome-b5 reductase